MPSYFDILPPRWVGADWPTTRPNTTETLENVQEMSLLYLAALFAVAATAAPTLESTVVRASTGVYTGVINETFPDVRAFVNVPYGQTTSGTNRFMPPLAVDESKRSESSKASAGKVGEWSEKGMRDFDPERWRVRDEQGRVSFNASAGTRHSFGAGPRGCFGKSDSKSPAFPTLLCAEC